MKNDSRYMSMVLAIMAGLIAGQIASGGDAWWMIAVYWVNVLIKNAVDAADRRR